MDFTLDTGMEARIYEWKMKEVYPAIILEQKASKSLRENRAARDSWELGYPYGGAIGGDTTYSFTPTSLGVVTKITCYGKELDLTEYGLW